MVDKSRSQAGGIECALAENRQNSQGEPCDPEGVVESRERKSAWYFRRRRTNEKRENFADRFLLGSLLLNGCSRNSSLQVVVPKKSRRVCF